MKDQWQVKLVVQDAGSAFAVAENGRCAPEPAARTGDALDVQGLGDLPGGEALRIVAEDPPHHLGLRPVDRAVAVFGFAVHRDARQHVIAVGITAGELAVLEGQFRISRTAILSIGIQTPPPIGVLTQ